MKLAPIEGIVSTKKPICHRISGEPVSALQYTSREKARTSKRLISLPGKAEELEADRIRMRTERKLVEKSFLHKLPQSFLYAILKRD
jgi:hypothetical protein